WKEAELHVQSIVSTFGDEPLMKRATSGTQRILEEGGRTNGVRRFEVEQRVVGLHRFFELAAVAEKRAFVRHGAGVDQRRDERARRERKRPQDRWPPRARRARRARVVARTGRPPGKDRCDEEQR